MVVAAAAALARRKRTARQAELGKNMESPGLGLGVRHLWLWGFRGLGVLGLETQRWPHWGGQRCPSKRMFTSILPRLPQQASSWIC